jgi:hypothetical protein
VVESQPSKLSCFAGVSAAGARRRNPERSRGSSGDEGGRTVRADVAQLVEHSLGKGEVTSSILVIGSRSLEVC